MGRTETFFADAQYANALFGNFDSGTQSGTARADYQNVG
jgi:hypothetical protein